MAALVRALGDEDADVRRAAVSALGQLGLPGRTFADATAASAKYLAFSPEAWDGPLVITTASFSRWAALLTPMAA